MKIEIECIWKKKSLAEQQQAVLLWNSFNLPEPEEVTSKWSDQIVFVAKKNQAVIGATSVNRVQVKLLNNNWFYEFRIFISPEHRSPALDAQLAVKTKEYFEINPQACEQCIGLIAVVENEKMKQNWNRAVWPAIDMVFAGYTPQGHHIRVSYFKGARI
jgi:hypothetical protein